MTPRNYIFTDLSAYTSGNGRKEQMCIRDRTDTMFLERQRGITIQAAVTSFQWHRCKVNIFLLYTSCDIYYISTASSRVVDRGCYNANPHGGVSMSNASYDSSNTSTSIGFRLAFRGRLVKASSAVAFKAISEVARCV